MSVSVVAASALLDLSATTKANPTLLPAFRLIAVSPSFACLPACLPWLPAPCSPRR